MDLKQFIHETISSIVDATAELQWKYLCESNGAIINPPVSSEMDGIYQDLNRTFLGRKITLVEFDVAVTASEGSDGGGKVGLRIFSAEIGVDGKTARKAEEVSRVTFTIPIALSPSQAELGNVMEKIRREQTSDG